MSLTTDSIKNTKIKPELYLKFIKLINGKPNLIGDPIMFQNNGKIEDLNIYPINSKTIYIPGDAIGILLYGNHVKYSNYNEKIIENKTKIFIDEKSKKIKIGLFLDGKINNTVNNINSHIYNHINFNEDKSIIISINLNESLINIADLNYEAIFQDADEDNTIL